MAVDIFLELTGVEGEAQDKTMKAKKAIDVTAFSWGVSQSGTTHMGKGGGSGKVNVGDIAITKYIDAASPTLLQFCCVGKHIDKGTLTVRKAGGDKDADPLTYIVIEFQELLVSSISTGGSGGEDRFMEQLSLNFREFHYKYELQAATGGSDASKEWKWDVAENASA